MNDPLRVFEDEIRVKYRSPVWPWLKFCILWGGVLIAFGFFIWLIVFFSHP